MHDFVDIERCWHANQNAEYLNKTIAPTLIPGTGGPTWDVVTSANFETDDTSNYESNENAIISFTAVGEGKGGEAGEEESNRRR